MMDFDVNTAANNINFSERTAAGSGQLMASIADFTVLSAGGVSYTIAANTSYTGVFSITRTGANSLDLTGSLYQGASLLSTYTATDSSATATSFGLLGFHVNSGVFGTSGTIGAADNGIDFSHNTIDAIVAAPEPSALAFAFMGFGGLILANLRRRR